MGEWGPGSGAGGAHLLQQQGGGWGSADSDEVERLRRELEEVRSEKVEMEYVMRERLEIIVTEEARSPEPLVFSAHRALAHATSFRRSVSV
jgi:hypothetical protein